jgi:hypothetical protein
MNKKIKFINEPLNKCNLLFFKFNKYLMLEYKE